MNSTKYGYTVYKHYEIHSGYIKEDCITLNYAAKYFIDNGM
jgi:hypothetical protein